LISQRLRGESSFHTIKTLTEMGSGVRR